MELKPDKQTDRQSEKMGKNRATNKLYDAN